MKQVVIVHLTETRVLTRDLAYIIMLIELLLQEKHLCRDNLLLKLIYCVLCIKFRFMFEKSLFLIGRNVSYIHTHTIHLGPNTKVVSSELGTRNKEQERERE